MTASIPAKHVDVLLRWFWRSTFAHRYSGNPARNIKYDVEQAIALRAGKVSTLEEIKTAVDTDFFLDNVFSSRTVATKALILLLANNQPRTFLSGQLVDLDEVL